MNTYSDREIVNIGTGSDITIAQLASMMADVTGFQGEIVYDASKPDGTPVKRLDVSKLSALGWQAQTSLNDGIKDTYTWFMQSVAQ